MEVFLDSDINQLLQIQEPPEAEYIPFWTSEAYGFGKYIREYGFYPPKLPLLIFTDHSGPSLRSNFNYYEINNSAPVIMFHSPKLVDKWRSLYKQKCFSLYSPFVYYRRKNRIDVMPDAKGTLAYPVHSMPELDDHFDAEKYIDNLLRLPEKYQPVSVSMHYHDLNIGRHEIFLRKGLRVFTSGNPHDYRFAERFYSILRQFKYSTSNFVGTALFYSVEMGIPFFVYGTPPVYKSNTDSELARIALESASAKDEMIEHITELFTSPVDKITHEQKQLVEFTLGLHHGVGRLKMGAILYGCYFQHAVQKLISKSKNFLHARMKF